MNFITTLKGAKPQLVQVYSFKDIHVLLTEDFVHIKTEDGELRIVKSFWGYLIKTKERSFTVKTVDDLLQAVGEYFK